MSNHFGGLRRVLALRQSVIRHVCENPSESPFYKGRLYPHWKKGGKGGFRVTIILSYEFGETRLRMK